ncbi:MAG: VacJ family lipoprotein [Desulfobacteraceae bacterium]|nr:MAG: VacJ family lipoprotein [Desulfobacteraceae bacterium]
MRTVQAGAILLICIFGMLFFSDDADAASKTIDRVRDIQLPAAGKIDKFGGPMDGFDEFDDFDEFETEPEDKAWDPLMGYNRLMTRVNDTLYVWVLRPTALVYGTVVKEPARLAVNRFFTNLEFPTRLANNLLQFKFQQAGTETVRFGFNTTFGLLGFFDPARSRLGLEPSPEDFGQTLGYWGVGPGFHIVLPLMGPSNLRDALGRGPDIFLSPQYYIGDDRTSLIISGIERANAISLMTDRLDAFRKDALDLYVFYRDAYEMNRKKMIEE